jgi:hypothetical protein
VRSERAQQRVMETITLFITQKLKLKVNEAKGWCCKSGIEVPIGCCRVQTSASPIKWRHFPVIIRVRFGGTCDIPSRIVTSKNL